MNETIGGLFVDLAASAQAFKADMAAARAALQTTAQGFQKLGSKISDIGKSVSAKLSAPMALFGGLSIKTAADFDDAMRMVAAKSKATEGQLASMTALARKMGADTRFTATQAAEGMTFLAQAGLGVDDVMKALPSTLALAATEGMDLGRAADIASNVMSGMGAGAADLARIVDILADASRSGNTNVEMLGESFSKVGPILRANGQSIEAGAAAFDLLGNAGIQAEEAGTGIKSAFAAMLTPSDKQKAIIEDLGVAFTDSQGRLLDFGNIIGQLGPHVENQAAMFELFGARGALVMTALAQAGESEFTRLRDQFSQSSGAAKEMSDVMEGGVGGSMRRAVSAFQELQIAIANSGLVEAVEKLAKVGADLTKWLSENNPMMLKFAAAFIAISAVAGPVLVALGSVIWALGAVWGAIGPVITGFAVFALGAKELQLLGGLLKIFGGAAAVVALKASGLAAAVAAVAYAAYHAGKFIGENLKAAIESAPEYMARFSDAAVSMKDRAVEAITSMVTKIKEAITGKLSSAMDAAAGKVDAVKQKFWELYDRVVGHSYVPDMVDGIKDEFSRLGNVMVDPADLAAGKVGDIFKSLGKQLKSNLSQALGNASSSLFSSAIGGFGKGGGSGMLGGLQNLLGFRDGGGFTVGGTGGIDSQLVAFRASPGETVDVRKPGQSGSGPVVHFTQNNALGVGAQVRAELAQMMPQMVEGVVAAVMDRRARMGAA